MVASRATRRSGSLFGLDHRRNTTHAPGFFCEVYASSARPATLLGYPRINSGVGVNAGPLTCASPLDVHAPDDPRYVSSRRRGTPS
jgi:hypothetical protein